MISSLNQAPVRRMATCSDVIGFPAISFSTSWSSLEESDEGSLVRSIQTGSSDG